MANHPNRGAGVKLSRAAIQTLRDIASGNYVQPLTIEHARELVKAIDKFPSAEVANRRINFVENELSIARNRLGAFDRHVRSLVMRPEGSVKHTGDGRTVVIDFESFDEAYNVLNSVRGVLEGRINR